MPIIKHKCANCATFWDETDLLPIKDFHERVEPDEVQPTGECPDCGCLCHEVEITVRQNFKVVESDADYGTLHIFGETREIAGLDALYEDKINAALDLTRRIARLLTPHEAFVAHYERQPGFVDDGLPQYGAHREPITAEAEVEKFVAETLDVHEEYHALIALIELARKAI
jgi:hypothetical protein